MPTNEILMDSRKFGILRGTEYERRSAALTAPGTTQEGLVPMSSKDTPNSKTESIPYGYCLCGCGERTTISPSNHKEYGWIKGQPRKYIVGHSSRKSPSPARWSDAEQCWVIELTQGLVAFVSDEDIDSVKSRRWFALRNYKGTTYYARTNINRKSVSMHRLIMSAPDGVEVDHINGNGLDNRRANLRLCTATENRQNTPSRRNKSSRFKGVYWHKSHRKWVAQIRANQQSFRIGEFELEVEAAKAYDDMAECLHGDFAYRNFPKEEHDGSNQ